MDLEMQVIYLIRTDEEDRYGKPMVQNVILMQYLASPAALWKPCRGLFKYADDVPLYLLPYVPNHIDLTCWTDLLESVGLYFALQNRGVIPELI